MIESLIKNRLRKKTLRENPAIQKTVRETLARVKIQMESFRHKVY